MQYGEVELNLQKLFLFVGSNPANDNATVIDDNSLSFPKAAVNQRDADLVYFWHKVSGFLKLRLFSDALEFMVQT